MYGFAAQREWGTVAPEAPPRAMARWLAQNAAMTGWL
jgi:hypothetical protein